MTRKTRAGHWTLALAVLSLPLAVTAEAATNCGSPGPNQAIVWEHYDFTGKCDVLEIGSYGYLQVLQMSVGDDSVSSVSVGSNVKVTLYSGGLPGTNPDAWLPMTTSRTVWPEFNDLTSSIRVEPRTGCPNPGPNQVVVWQNPNFLGNCDVLDAGYPVTYEQILGLSVGNDAITSVRCGSSASLLLWEHALNGGRSAQTEVGCSISGLWNFNEMTSSMVPKASVPTGCGSSADCREPNTFCQLPDGVCGGTPGTCTIKPTVCDFQFAPTCGCDGITYGNDCERRAAGVSKWDYGWCP
jgi:hypothetical protein